MKVVTERWHGPPEPDPLMMMLIDENWCLPEIEIAYDQWARTRITCDHGTFEAVSNFLNLTQSYRRACKLFNEHEHTPKCCKECDPPTEWTEEYWRTHKAECDLFKGHEGDCRVLSEEEEEARRRKRYT